MSLLSIDTPNQIILDIVLVYITTLLYKVTKECHGNLYLRLYETFVVLV